MFAIYFDAGPPGHFSAVAATLPAYASSAAEEEAAAHEEKRSVGATRCALQKTNRNRITVENRLLRGLGVRALFRLRKNGGEESEKQLRGDE
jgi:hypothetical protein